MKITYVMTEDGRIEVQWWEKGDFKGRSTSIYTADSTEDILKGTNLKLVNYIPIPDDSIVCDLCNAGITEFPVPVVLGSYALCKGCLESIQVKGGEDNG